MRLSVARVYRGTALLFFNTVLALILVNVLLLGAFRVNDSIAAHRLATVPGSFGPDGAPVSSARPRSSYQLEWFDYAACQERGVGYANDVLDDFYDLTAQGFVYQPWVQFSEPPFRGRRVSVELDRLGFPMRHTTNAATSTDSRDTVDVFVFGGSTTFGYHVADEDTWPSQLAQVLNDGASGTRLLPRVRVNNYGRGYYNPSQELGLFLDLLKTGHRPALAIFMDGVNVGPAEDIPDFSSRVSAAVGAAQTPPSLRQALLFGFERLPIGRLGEALRSRLTHAGLVSLPATPPEDPREWGDDYISMAAQRFAVSRVLTRDVGREFGVNVQFFLQPNPMVDYRVDLYRRPLSPRLTAGRERARRITERLRAQEGAVDLGGLFERWGIDRKAIVDYLHYSPAFNRFLAEEVARQITPLLRSSGTAPGAAPRPTGHPREMPARP